MKKNAARWGVKCFVASATQCSASAVLRASLALLKKKYFIKRKQLFPFSPLQVLLGPIWPEREEEAAAHQDHVHQLPAEGAGARVRRDALPGHLHPGGAGAEDRPDRGPSTGVPSGF